MSYYNTNNERSAELMRSMAKTKKQEELIYYIFSKKSCYRSY